MKNPFARTQGEILCGHDRLMEVRTFTYGQCCDALNLDFNKKIHLQKTVREAIEVRLWKLKQLKKRARSA